MISSLFVFLFFDHFFTLLHSIDINAEVSLSR
jgi:hypothetical protein